MTLELFSSTTTPLTPPKLEEDRSSWLRLYRSRGVGVHTFFRLMSEYGSARQVLELLPDLAAKAGVSRYAPADEASIRAEWRAGHRQGARLICFGDPDYPALLAQIPDPPPVFWALGRLELLHNPTIAIVGARNASSLGERMARKLAQELGEAGFTIVSGLARGIDTAAHEGSLRTGTAAVQGGGVDVPYPRENTKLHAKLGQKGVVLSEQPMGTTPQSRHFPRRNRIVTGLAMGVIVVEATARSGSLLSARNAAEQGREVMAIPGHPMDARASGCNILLRDGATLIRGAQDVIEALSNLSDTGGGPFTAPEPARSAPEPAPGPAPKTVQTPVSGRTSGDLHAEILNRLGPAPVSEDQLLRDLNLPPTHLAPVVLDLEIAGKIQRHAGGLLSRV